MYIRTLLISALAIFANVDTVRQDEICGEFDGRRMYLELGEYGLLEARNQTRDLVKRDVNHRRCTLELITCPSCIIYIKFNFLNISRNCGKNSVLDSCGCDYVWIYEPPFEDVSGEQFCGHFIYTNRSILTYRSQTRSTAITFLYSSYYQHAFTLEYTSLRNRRNLNGYPKYLNPNNVSQFITSPFFPSYYPRDLNTEYIINCKTSEDCRVRLIFTDFIISPNSLIEFFDWNGQRMHVATGTVFRPPLLISSGPSMVIRFYANGGTNLGFKASYMFLLGDQNNSTLKPDTDCGGYVDNLGGGITMMNMIKEGTIAYDCFWIIRPPESYLHLKTQLYLKVISFSKFAGSTELIIKQGMTSNEPFVETLRHPVSHYVIAKQKEHLVPITQGFYVSLKGLFRAESVFAIVYTAFNYKDCYSGSDFLCRNLRCIPAYLICDGLDHCGDNSDETTNCLQDYKERMRWAQTPNFFFPKVDRYSYLKTATIVFLICSLGLISLIFTLLVMLYKINSRNRNQRQLQSHLQTINDMLAEGTGSIIEEEIVISDEPPIYEAPPDYDDVLKMVEKKIKKRAPQRPPRRASCSCHNFRSESNVSEPGTSRSCQTTPLPAVTPVPDSPPPIYTFLPSIKITLPEDCSREIAGTNSDLPHFIDIGPIQQQDGNSFAQGIQRTTAAGETTKLTLMRYKKYMSLQNLRCSLKEVRTFGSMGVLNNGTCSGLARYSPSNKVILSFPTREKFCSSDGELLTVKRRELLEMSGRFRMKRSTST